jgi:hypothetical protein
VECNVRRLLSHRLPSMPDLLSPGYKKHVRVKVPLPDTSATMLIPSAVQKVSVSQAGEREVGKTAFIECPTPFAYSANGKMLQDFRTSGLQDFRTSGLQDFRTSGLQDFRTSGLQDFRTSGRKILSLSSLLRVRNVGRGKGSGVS